MTTEHRIQRRISSDKIQFTTNIDLNALFNLNYNFDLLKGIIEELLNNQQILQDQMDGLKKDNKEKNNIIKDLLENKAVIDKISKDFNDINSHLKRHDDQIDNIYDKIRNFGDRVDSLENLRQLLEQSKDKNIVVQSADTEKLMIMIKDLEIRTNNHFETNDKAITSLKDEVERLEREFNKLDIAHNDTVTNVSYNKEQIEILYGKLEDVNNKYKEGDRELIKEIDNLKKYIFELTKQVQSQLSNQGAKIGEEDLKNINDFMQRVRQLENEFNEYVKKANIETLWNEIKNKADNSIIEEIKKQLDEFQKQLSDLLDKFHGNHTELQSVKSKINELYRLIAELTTAYESFKDLQQETSKSNIDITKYVTITQFDEYKKENDQQHQNFNRGLSQLRSLIDELFELMKTKANVTDIKALEQLIQTKIEELMNYCNRKFADKNETTKNFSKLEQQIKQILSSMSKNNNDNGDNWLLAKKPLGGHSCASCEAYIGDLKDTTKYVPWNKYPLRDPNEKLYRIGSGFSKMLQMINIEEETINTHLLTQGNIICKTSTNFHQSTSPKKKNVVYTSKNFYHKTLGDQGDTIESLPKIPKKKKNNNLNNFNIGIVQDEGDLDEEEEGPKM